MAFRAAKTCRKKYLNQFPRIGGAEDLTAKTNQVEVVVLDALVRGKGFMDQAGADPWDLVRGDADSDSAPQMATPRSILPSAMARAKGIAKSG